MIQKIKLTALILASFLSLNAYSEDSDNGQSRPIYIIGGGDKSIRPKMPCVEIANGYYLNGIVLLSFNEIQGQIKIEINEITTGETQVFVFRNVYDVEFYVGEIISAKISITTSDGQIYESYF